jgi:hypothetical protein
VVILPELKIMLMAIKKKKPSKRGKKAKKVSLHCSPMIVTQEKKIKKWTKWIKAIVEFVKALIQLSNVIKPLVEWCKSLLELL